jgi:hypothetical protein
MPSSPTLNRKSASKTSKNTKASSPTPIASLPNWDTATSGLRPSTPSTPPPRQRNHTSSNLQISSVRTPLSHKGLHMSPSPSLAHYKSNLDPPPAASFHGNGTSGDPEKLHLGTSDREGVGEEESENVHTPSRKRSIVTGSGVFPPVTPKTLAFPGSVQDSPFRTPGGRFGLHGLGLGMSPFPTPGSRSIYDPHDTGALLDEALSRFGGGGVGNDSPAGLFGRSGLLYESPGAPSPRRWMQWW